MEPVVSPDGTHEALVAGLRDALRRPGDPPVEVRETHCHVIFLTPDRVYKLKKPVAFAFLDMRTAQARREACEQEVAVNQALAPQIVLGTRTVVPHDGSFALASPDDPRAVEHLVEMRRFDEERTMAAMLERGELTLVQARAVGRRIARFHRDAPRIADPPDPVSTVERNLTELEPLCGDIAPDGLAAARRFATSFLAAWEPELADRARRGRVIDGHGDLRAEHVLLEDAGVTIVDRLEFDPMLRAVDVADDLAFLLMDLESLDAPAVADAVLDGYGEAAVRPPAQLLAFYGAYRAQVRAKVTLLRAGQTGDDAEARDRARALLRLAERLAWRAHGALILVVAGPPASGKSTLAEALARVSGRPVLSSDHVRREARGRSPDYSIEGKAGIYHELGRRARRLPAAIVDATFGAPELRTAFLDGLGRRRRPDLAIVECRAPLGVIEQRARRRATAGGSESDAGPEVALTLASTWTPFEGPVSRLVLDATDGPAAQVDDVASWLDARLAQTPPCSAP